jgi:hypothetical protein
MEPTPTHWTFQQWCRHVGGVKRAAELLGITERAVMMWYQVKTNPSVPMMQRLIALSHRKLSYESIINSTQPKEKRGALYDVESE